VTGFSLPDLRHQLSQKFKPDRLKRVASYSSSNFFLCLDGLTRLSGMTRAAGGDPARSRARRRASRAAVNFLGFDLDLLLLMENSENN
jgi:hypothetical protein